MCDFCNREVSIYYKEYLRNISNGNKYSCSIKCGSYKAKETNIKKIIVMTLKKNLRKLYSKIIMLTTHINTRKLKFDFYLIDKNICIEFDGYQHFNSVKWFGGLDYLTNVKNKDLIKNNFCLENNIRLLRIKYDSKKDIDKILDNFLNKI